MNPSSAARVVLDPGGEGVVGHLCLHLLCSLADRLGLTEALSDAIPARWARAMP